MIESATCTVVFAIVFGIVSCTGGTPFNIITGPNARSMGWMLSHLFPTTAALPHSGTQAPLIAALFQTSRHPIQQSFQGLSCGAFEPGSIGNWSGGTLVL